MARANQIGTGIIKCRSRCHRCHESDQLSASSARLEILPFAVEVPGLRLDEVTSFVFNQHR
jgi:hypothetical protein